MKKIILMASGEGSNFSAIIDNKIKIDRVITDNKNANVIKRAEKVNVPIFVFDYKEGEYKNGFGWCERKIDETIPDDVDLIVLAGYMRILSPRFVEKCFRFLLLGSPGFQACPVRGFCFLFFFEILTGLGPSKHFLC